MRGHIIALVLVLAVFLAVDPSSAQVSDSTGVRVITNPAPKANGLMFKLSAKPRTVIGAVEGAPEYQLFRANQALVFSDGTIVVSNTGTQQLRFYDRSGKYLRTAGGKGEGPGEFMQLTLVGALDGDSLVALDGQQKRVSVFDKTGALGRSFTPPSELGFLWLPMGILSDGRIGAIVSSLAGGPAKESNPRLRRPQALYLIARDGSAVQSLGEFPGFESTVSTTMSLGLPLGRSLFARASNNRIAIGNNDAYSIRIYDGTGKMLQVFRQTRQPVEARKADYVLGLPPVFRTNAPPNAIVQRMQPLIDQAYKYTTLPAFGNPGDQNTALRFDTAGNLWVQEYAAVDQNDSWQAFSPAGVYLGRLDLPARTTLFEIGADWVLAKVLDDLDVEHIVVYGLEKP